MLSLISVHVEKTTKWRKLGHIRLESSKICLVNKYFELEDRSCLAVNPLNGILKVITAMENGYIPPNLHFKTPSDKIPALTEGRCKVLTELTSWSGDYAVVNSISFSGVCSNIILKDFKKEKKNNGQPDDSLPRLVIASGCTEHAVDLLLCDVGIKLAFV